MSTLRGRFLRGVVLLLGLALGPVAECAEAAGKVVFAKGATSLQPANGGSLRMAGSGDALNPGDVVSTGKRSFAVVELSDLSRIVLRAESRFAVETWKTEAGQESGILSLFEGGFRAVTGFLNKRRPGAVKVRSPTATIGVRGTDFAARICAGEDCKASVPKRPQGVSLLELFPRTSGLAAGDASPPVTNLSGTEPGLHVSVFDGEVEVSTPAGEVVLAPGDNGFVGGGPPLAYEAETPVARVDSYSAIDPLAAPSDWNSVSPADTGDGQCGP